MPTNPPLYPHVINGGDCECGHRRLAHVEKIPETRNQTFTDGHCQRCDCKHWKPVETHTEFLARMLHETFESQAYHHQRMAELDRRRIRTLIPFVAALVLLLATSMVVPDPYRVFALIAVQLTVAGFMFAQIPRARRDGETMMTISYGVIGGLNVIHAIFATLGWPVLWLAGVMCLFLVFFSVYALWDIHSMKKEWKVVEQHITNHYAELRGQSGEAEES